ncbi:MAG: hypothetical protein J5793_01030, partial [Clostridia bacterium]|nr:hypothetical protein [Clostridia bacterium]
DYECQYAFRGVIVGTSYTQIINKSPNPLVKVSNGCVVKKVWLQVDASIPLNQASNLPFRYDDAGCKNYGAVIGQVMGGDTIIDHVGVSFTGSATFSLSGTYKKLVPIGGFVGVVVNGGVVFRNMSDVTEKVGLTSSTLSYVANDDWLYVNPIVGRVITGYAFNETTAYEADPDDVMLDNGVNNYSIPDLNKNTSGKIGVTASSEYSHEITVPDPQSLYLLACIVNSGAGSAQYGSNTNAYPAMTNTPWSGYRKYTQTRCGTYDDVGTTESSSADYTDVAEQDVYLATGEVAKVPYIIRKYTSADGGVFKARSICNGSAPADAGNTNDTAKNASNADPEKNRAAVRKVELASGDFELPASFRGIGSLYYADSRVRLVFNRFDGKGANIIYNTYFLDYDMRGGSTSSTPATVNGVIKRTYENYSNVTHVGLGLFSQFEQRGATSSNTTNVITGFTVNGSIYYDIINYSNGGSVAYNWEKNTVNAVFHYNVLNVGGVIGSVYGEGKNSAKTNYRDIFYITGVTLGDIDFEGAKSVGGLVGFVYHNGDSRTRVIKKCGSASGTGVKITAGLNGGGLVGYLHRNFTITGNSASNKTEVFVDSIKIKGTNTTGGNVTDVGFDYINGERLFAAGGLIGFTDPKYACSITNYRVAGVEKTGAHIYSTNTDADVHIFAGGIIGVYKNATLTLTNLDVSGLDLKATYSGGVFGAFLHDNSGGMTITATNITVDGGSGKSDIEALRTASGFIARNESTNQNGVSITTLTNFKLKNYNVKSTSTTATGITTQGYSSAAYMQAAGAISGYSETTHNNGNTYKLHEITVEDCDISANFEGNNETDGVGGLFGAARNLYVTGANILLDGTTVNYYPNGAAEASNTDYRVGGVLGNNMNTLTGSNVRSYIKLVGVSIHDCNELTRLCGKRNDSSGGENFGPDGYIVLADFYGASAEDGRNTSHATLATGSTERAAAAPYVTVNPASNIGNSQVRLTGDGIAPNEDSLPAEDILDNDWRYNYVQSINRSTGQLYDSYFKIFKNYNYVNKLSTFNTEQSNSLTDDFAVLVIEETNRNRCTNIINGYLNLLANTNYDYASVNDAIYTVNIYRMNYNGTKFAPVENTEANLKRDTTNHHFYMLNTNESTDTSASGAGTLFSLIDVAFYDPAENTKIAYHLYVPVIVKKLLKFNFEVATGSGTNYESAWYGRNDRYGQPVMENLGTPVTIYFSYDYLRSKAEWQQALDNGENMLRNYAKSLVFVKDGALENYLPADTTVLVLVDPNNGGKAYYARFADVYSNGTLSLSGFRERLDDATSAAFAPVTFDDMLDISAEPGDGSYVEWQQGDSAAATVTAVYNNNVLRLRPATDADSSRQHYNLIVENDDDPATGHLDAKESYYISFFTASQSGALLYHYRIECPQSFDDPNYPSRMGNRNAEETVAHMILGNIFVQTGASLAATNVNEEMVVSENDTLTVSMETTVKINDSIRSEVAGYLAVNSPIQVYQSFLVDLTRTEKDGSHRKIITGYPEFTGSTYGIASVNGSVAAIEDDYPTITQNPNYAEFINGESLNAYLTGGNGAVITADVNIIYSGSENIAAQFPSKGDLSDRSTGVTIAGTSNVAFDPASTAFSTSRQEMTDTNNRLYYCLIDDNTAKLYYNVKSDIYGGDYGALGINPLDTDGLTLVGVSTIAVHDITNIFDDAAEYDIVRCTIQLYRRQDNYLTPLVIGDYLQDLNLVDLESATGFRSVKTDPTKYIYYFPKSAANTELETNIVIPIDFGVITGADLESEGYYYSNYKVALDVELVKETTPGNYARLQKSRDSNFIIYTNARIIPDFVDTD